MHIILVYQIVSQLVNGIRASNTRTLPPGSPRQMARTSSFLRLPRQGIGPAAAAGEVVLMKL
jgi:hypothetical protein